MKTTLTTKAYDRIKEWIVRYQLKPGARLDIGELSEALHMSRTPVREALSRLEQEHLVDHQPMRGFVVKPLVLRDVEDIYDIRCALEVLAVQQAARRLSERDRKHLEHILAQVSTLIRDGKKNRTLGLEQEFHRCILEASGNPLLVEVGKGILDRIWALQRLNLLTSDHLTEAHGEHAAVVHALEMRNSRKAAALMKKHLDLAKRFILKRLKDHQDIISKALTGMPGDD
ncbi:MAG: GntR family transcriptional regulator [Desulfatiglandaceae bacterium]